MAYAGQPQVLKWYNSDMIGQLILEKGPISKPELAQLTNLSLPTVNKIVDALVADGVVVEHAVQTGSGVGRKAMTYIVDGSSGSLLIIYYLDGKWIGASVNILGSILSRMEIPVMPGKTADYLTDVYELVDLLLGETEKVKAIGIGIPGVVLTSGEIVSIPSFPPWEGINLQSILEDRYHLPVFVENDVKLMTIGYYTKNMKALDNIVFFYIGSGIGAGVIINGQLYKGNSSFAGEFGYMLSESDSSEAQPKCSGGSLENCLMELRAHLQTDPDNEQYREAFYTQIGKVLINCATVVNPEAIVLYGKELDEQAIAFLQKEISRYLPQHCIPEIKLTKNSSYGISGLIRLCLDGISRKCWLLEAVEGK